MCLIFILIYGNVEFLLILASLTNNVRIFLRKEVHIMYI